MDNIILSGVLAFSITFFAIPIIIQVSREKKLFDEPDERKVHKMVIPTLGGLGIFAGFILAMLLGAPSGNPLLQYYVAAAIVIFFLGIKDDILILSPAKKFIGQLIAAGIIIKFGGVQIMDMHGFLGMGKLPYLAGIIFTLFTVIVIVNSFNLIDGVDGLAGCLGLLTAFVFGAYFYYVGELTYAVMAFSLAGSLIGFLLFNFSPAKIFMGDTGSLLIGLVNSILVIRFINMAATPGVKLVIDSAPAIGFAILIVPLFDTLRVFGLRILNRRSPFSGDRTHVHHFLLDLGLSHRAVTISCVSANIALLAFAFLLRGLGTTAVVGILLLTALSLIGIIYYFRSKVKARIKTTTPASVIEEKILSARTVLSFSREVVEAE
jgi:UDP-GlcNAc:undecaprenyl-phosphate/decaprenyl-phosphate GlcNAc-1-phosphate transferase